MNFNLRQAIEILEKTPDVLFSQLSALNDEWIYCNEGENTWSVFDILGHLVHGEKADWMNRIHIILSESETKKFTPFDRFAQLEDNREKTLHNLLKEFKTLRNKNLIALSSLKINESDLLKTGIHPNFGEVTLAHLLSTWVVHDLNHLSQINRVMAKRLTEDVGPWKEYLPILKITK